VATQSALSPMLSAARRCSISPFVYARSTAILLISYALRALLGWSAPP